LKYQQIYDIIYYGKMSQTLRKTRICEVIENKNE